MGGGERDTGRGRCAVHSVHQGRWTTSPTCACAPTGGPWGRRVRPRRHSRVRGNAHPGRGHPRGEGYDWTPPSLSRAYRTCPFRRRPVGVCVLHAMYSPQARRDLSPQKNTRKKKKTAHHRRPAYRASPPPETLPEQTASVQPPEGTRAWAKELPSWPPIPPPGTQMGKKRRGAPRLRRDGLRRRPLRWCWATEEEQSNEEKTCAAGEGARAAVPRVRPHEQGGRVDAHAAGGCMRGRP